MKTNILWVFPLASFVFLLSGCGALIVGAAAVGTGTGTYYYINGGLQTDYKTSYDKVWAACEKTLADMHALNVKPVKEIGKGTISSVINDEDVQFDITYREKNVTSVIVRVGFFGNKTASRLLHDKISENI